MQIGKRAEALILSFEGWDVPWAWPGGASGITLPIGYDLGYENFARDWAGLLPEEDFKRLSAVVGLKGQSAARVASTLKGIHIGRDAANRVFDTVTLPHYEALTVKTFPNADKMPPDAFGAMVSLVFNRGESLEGDRRREMRVIHDILARQDPTAPETLEAVAAQIRSMARLWPDNVKSDGDLHDRRMAEAALVG